MGTPGGRAHGSQVSTPWQRVVRPGDVPLLRRRPTRYARAAVLPLLEALLVVLVPLGLALAAARGARRRLRVALTALALLAAAGAVRAAGGWPRPAPPSPAGDRPLVELRGQYVGAAACQACHPGEHASWAASFHATMTQDPAAPGAVLGDFGDAAGPRRVQVHGREWRLGRDADGTCWAERDGPAGPDRRPVALLTGSHHMQVSWLATGATRVLEQLPLVWHRGEGRWIPRNAGFLRPPEVSDAPPSERGRWNLTCLRCHTVDPRPLVLGGLGAMDTRVGQLGISCESCHGPGAEHAARNRDPARRYGLHLGGGGDPTIVNPARLPAARAREVCGQCHSISSEKSVADWGRWLQEGFAYRPGDELSATRAVSRFVPEAERPARAASDPLLAEILAREPTYFDDRFWRDGEVRVTGRELHGVTDGPCSGGVSPAGQPFTCTTCHALHRRPDDPRPAREWRDDQLSAALAADADAACVQCHAPQAAQGSGHTRHAPGSPGASCVECHLPRTTYGLHQAIRTHRVGSPSVATALATGRPDACTLCHLDRPLGWTAERLQAGWGVAPPPLEPEDRRLSAGLRLLLSGDAGQRALVAWHAGHGPTQRAAGTSWLAPHLAVLLEDPYEAVRAIAARSLATLPGVAARPDFLAPAEARAAARAGIVERWGGAPDRAADGAALLLDPRGGLDLEVQRRLVERRDDRRVDLIE
jgi:hypothetical protein